MEEKLINGYKVPASCQVDTRYLSNVHHNPQDKLIAFDEKPHVYYVEGQTGFTSVTTFIHKFFPPLDGPFIASCMARSPNFPSAEKFKNYRHLDKFSGTIVEDIQKVWEEQANLGTELHAYIETYFNEYALAEDQEEKFVPSTHQKKDDATEYGYFFRYARFVHEAGWKPYRTEWMIFDKPWRITGSIDMIFVDPASGEFHMRDWKRSKAIRSTGNARGYGPCEELKDCNMMHYSLQLNLYKKILEKNYGLKIATMALVIFHPNNDDFLVFDVTETPFQGLLSKMLV